jgi:hypothetical protein
LIEHQDRQGLGALLMQELVTLELLRATVVVQAIQFKKPAAPATKECPYCASNIPLKCPLCTFDLGQKPA